MNRFNDIGYPANPETNSISDSELSETAEYLDTIQELNAQRKRKKEYSFDDWCMIYSDDLWYLWCIISDYKKNVKLLDCMDYSGFCCMCYDNSTKH